VRRLLALVLAVATFSSVGTVASLHVHEYVGHDHPEHHHGLAVHDHDADSRIEGGHHGDVDDDHELSIEAVSCRAGRHAVGIRTTWTNVHQVHVDLAEIPGPALVIPAPLNRPGFAITDVRVHGPPSLRQLPARAPPVSQPA
jgi:hypothetical protein